jgi:biopolymer transport protein ExbD
MAARVSLPIHKKARIEMIPLIDVIFFCLATFVLFTLTLNKTKSVDVNLAVATESIRPLGTERAVTVAITERGEMFWEKEPVTYDQFLIRLVEFSRQPEPRLLLNLDERFQFSGVINVLNEIRKAGIAEVGVMTRTKPREG